jgi:ABC-2 type transport system ATP-binding protein
LDPLGIEIIKERLLYLCKEKKVSVLFSSHQLAEVAELSEELIVISGGEIKYTGSYETLIEGSKKYRLHLSAILPDTLKFDSKVRISGDRKELLINHADCLLDESIRSLHLHDLAVESIDIEESALLDLFKE